MPFTFYPAGPPVPFVAMLPLYNFQNETGTADTSRSHFAGEEGINDNESGQNYISSERFDQPEVTSSSGSMIMTAYPEPEEHKSYILNGDFASHWQNLQYGRVCQNSQYPASLLYPSPVVVPPFYLQGCFPWDGPGRPVGTSANNSTQHMVYGPHIPVASVQSVSSRATAVYQHYAEEMPTYRCGTGTYFPNPKAAVPDRHPTSRKWNYSYDRSDPHCDREGNWNISKSRAASCSHNSNQGEKPVPRPDRISPSGSGGERPWASHRQELHHSFQSENGPNQVPAHSGPANATYGMHPLAVMDLNGLSSNGANTPFFGMLYRYNHNPAYINRTE